ncbi:cell division cycle-associated protein 2 isoform 2-T2 [Anableps anableps]
MFKMASDQAITIVPKGDQENMSPTEEDAPTVINEISGPLNFSELTPHQFGISVESFIPSSNCKGTSRLAQVKARRRSSVGVRGSPETNSLIRFRAQQRMKTPPASHTLELVRSSPFFPRAASTLRQKMASFQSLMDVVEGGACDPTPAQDSDTGGCISTRDYLSDGLSCSEEKENNPPATPPPSKHRRLGPPEGCCSVEIREGNISILHSSLEEQENAFCKHQTPSRAPSDDPSAVSPAQQSHLLHIPSLPSLLEMKPTDADKTPVVKKKKQVRFGGPLSPEFFDKNLPPSTPLKKGGTPAQAPTPGRGSQPRSVLKTPQRRESDAQQNQLELLSPTGFGGSPTFSMPPKHRMSLERGDSKDGKIVFPSMEEIDSAVSSDAECAFNAQPLNLNVAFHEESLSHDLRESDLEPNQTSQMDECESAAKEKQPNDDGESCTPTQSRNRRRVKNKEPSEREPQERPGKRKRKLPEDGEPVKRSTRSAAKSACRKMKMAASATGRWNKAVDYSLYGSRAYASKNPTLSPIRERLSFIRRSPAVQQTPESPTATHEGSVVNLHSVRLPTCSPGRSTRQPRSTVGRGQKSRKVSVADCEVLQEENTEQHLEVEVSQGAPSVLTKCEPRGADPEEPSAHMPAADVPHSDSSKSEHHASLPAPSSSCAPLGQESSNAEPARKQAKQGRRSSALLDCGGTGNEATREQGTTRSSSKSQEEGGGPSVDLAPWQADFNFEDVFKPVATRRQRSVRRSLRNQASSELCAVSAGLAWVPHTSPNSIKETRRRTRQRRLSAALPEETRESSSHQPRPEKESLEFLHLQTVSLN